MPTKSRKKKRAPATRRSLSGAGFEFEDLIGAWLLVKMLTGESAPAIGGVGIQLQEQVSALGWHIDDLLLTTQNSAGVFGHLAISAKGNFQVNASGLPADFVNRAWKQWQNPQSPMNRSSDGLALVTLGTHSVFDPVWREVKGACTGSDIALTMSQIRSNSKQSKVFNSIQQPENNQPAASDAETIELIRRLHVLPTDLQSPHSESKNQTIAQCRQILVSRDVTEAEKLWQYLVNLATDLRLRRGTITLLELLANLRKEFELRQHPDYACDWETLSSITSDYKARIETELPSGFALPRTDQKSKVETSISGNAVTAVVGESGVGKSALVKNVIDAKFGTWMQVWFGPEELKTALSASQRRKLPLKQELGRILNASINTHNVLVIDSAERIDPTEFGVIKQFLQTILAPAEETWRVVVTTQAQGWGGGAEAMLGSFQTTLVDIGILKNPEVKSALRASPSLGWLSGHEDTISAMTNLRVLAWVIAIGASLESSASGLTSHTAIADHLWSYWTKGRLDLKRLMMNLAKREASFERSFALTDLDQADVATLTPWPDSLPLQLNPRTNCIEFEHDLAADWARFQFLKQIWTDTAQWAALSENPLWTNALRMLGQYLLRETVETRTGWDAAFAATEGAKLNLAGDILLDALCLDPEAERFLTERVDLLFAEDTKLFTRLLNRFRHIGTMPIASAYDTASPFSLYLETQHRSVIIERWFPILRFLIAQRERLKGLVSPPLARVIQTWLNGVPSELENGMLVPFRQDLAEMALAMARTVQVEKGYGVIYLNSDSLLYTAVLAGSADIPDEVGAWALELAGRRAVADEVNTRMAEAQRQKAEQHAERLRSDPEYKRRVEAKRRLPPGLGSMCEKLPPWPLGASHRVDMDFRIACLKGNSLQSLMRARPEVAAEVLLALIIDDQPEREYGAGRYEVDLGLVFMQESYPTAFWKTPFLLFFQITPKQALNTLITLVDFCTERWVAEIMHDREGDKSCLTLQLAEDEEKTFAGGHKVFDWTQTNSTHNGNLFCALDALERWLTYQLDAGVDITPYVEQIFHESSSMAFIGLLVNVGKYQPSLFSGVLSPLLTNPHLFFWDSSRVSRITENFIGWSWAREGEAMFELARGWVLAPHRQKTLLAVVVDLLHAESPVAKQLRTFIPKWDLPKDEKRALDFKLLFAQLDSDNYRALTDPETKAEVPTFVCPADLILEVESWRSAHAKPLQYLLIPDRCENFIQTQQPIGDDVAAQIFNLLNECEAEETIGEDDKARCKLALSASLIVLAEGWLTKTPSAMEKALSVIRTTIRNVTSSTEEIRSRRIGHSGGEFRFAAYAAMHLWTKNDDQAPEWEAAVLCLLTSGYSDAAGVIVGRAFLERKQLGSAWWRLLQAGVFWAGLLTLSPKYGDGEGVKRVWNVWLERLRRFPLLGKEATADDLKFARVAAACERLDYYRRMRTFTSGENQWWGEPELRTGMGLDYHFLGLLFHWLVQGSGTGDWAVDTNLIMRLWTYEMGRAEALAKEDSGEYDLPSQNLGYDLLSKLAELSLVAPENEAQRFWISVLKCGPKAHYALEHFVNALFLRLSKGDNPTGCERVWREAVEYGLAAKWVKGRFWYYGERIICILLGFGHEKALQQLEPGAALRMRDVYERWAEDHLGCDEDNLKCFCYFLTTEFGASLRSLGLCWIATLLKAGNSSSRWYRDGTGDSLIELLNTSINQDVQILVNDSKARQALVEITAVLAAQNIPTALTLQERIKHLR